MTSELRIVILGKSGTGKSATGNTILGQNVFREEHSDGFATKETIMKSRENRGRHISVIDTPGIFNTEMTSLKNEIDKCMALSLPGPHAFLLVLKLGDRITKEESNAVNLIKEIFGEKASKHTIVVLTYEDQMDKPAEDYLNDSPKLKKIVNMCRGRYVVFNNKTDDIRQVDLLINTIDKMVEWNGSHYKKEQKRDSDGHRNWQDGGAVGGASVAPVFTASLTMAVAVVLGLAFILIRR